VHEDVLPHTLDVSQFDSTQDLDAFLSSRRIWATTCSNATSHVLFSRFRAFDYCIIDEASQLILPICVGPILLAKAFILVGDHKQVGL
jgi:DNA replication ATP-dependent helicase Dna2